MTLTDPPCCTELLSRLTDIMVKSGLSGAFTEIDTSFDITAFGLVDLHLNFHIPASSNGGEYGILGRFAAPFVIVTLLIS